MNNNLFNYKTKLTRAFTLIELLVVVSIIGMLASVILVSLQGARSKAKDIKLIAEIKELQKAMELFRLDKNGYPGSVTSDYGWHKINAACPNVGWHLIDEAGMFDQSFKDKYMPKLPTEVVSCGMLYSAINSAPAPGNLEQTNQRCASLDSTGNIITTDPDGYDPLAPNGGVTGPKYAYVFLVTFLTNQPNTTYPIVYTSGQVPNMNSLSRCILGPQL